MIYYSMMPSLWDALGPAPGRGHSGRESAESVPDSAGLPFCSDRLGDLEIPAPGSQSGSGRAAPRVSEVQTPRLCQD
eukprot:151861-Hanusia_phi.AAC.1